MRFKHSSYARLRTGEMGRTLADLYNADGLIVDRIVGATKSDCLETIAIQYPGMKVLDHDGGKIRLRRPRVMMHDRGGSDPSVVDNTVSDILREILGERALGRIKPFVEGEHIGVIPMEHREDLK